MDNYTPDFSVAAQGVKGFARLATGMPSAISPKGRSRPVMRGTFASGEKLPGSLLIWSARRAVVCAGVPRRDVFQPLLNGALGQRCQTSRDDRWLFLEVSDEHSRNLSAKKRSSTSTRCRVQDTRFS
jgi:hypothetical protein